MSSASTSAAQDEQALLDAARGGDEDAFRRLVEPRRGELQAHCYRMLGSIHDAEDALQDAMLRAWKGLARLEDHSAMRAWLYRISTNTCLDAIGKRPKRVLPIDYGPASDPHGGPGEPVVESVWIEPIADETLSVEDGYASPDANFEQREAVELAFIAALQHLPANQRAVLILREVLGFSAKEVAETLDTTVASVNSALQRARASLEARTPERSQQQTLEAIGDDELRAIVDRYVEAWERTDVETVVSMLAEDATFAMPPAASWFGPRDQIAEFLKGFAMSGAWRWKGIRVQANGQVAIGFYAWDDDAQAYLAFALNVLTFRGREIADVTAFINRSIAPEERESYHRWVDQPADAARLEGTFGRFGLPDRID